MCDFRRFRWSICIDCGDYEVEEESAGSKLLRRVGVALGWLCWLCCYSCAENRITGELCPAPCEHPECIGRHPGHDNAPRGPLFRANTFCALRSGHSGLCLCHGHAPPVIVDIMFYRPAVRNANYRGGDPGLQPPGGFGRPFLA